MPSPVVDFTSLDYDSLVEAMKKYAQEKYGSAGWTDFNSNQFAVMLLELMGYAGDLAFFQINALTRETIVALLTREQNLRNIGKYLDFAIPSAEPASGQLTLTLNPGDLPYTLPSTFQFGTDDADNQVIFQPKADTIIAATPATIDVVEGQGFYNELVATSTGQQNQKWAIANSPLIDGTLTVLVNGIAWTQVSNFARSTSSDKHFVVDTDEDSITSLVFGDGVNGLVPPSTQEIRADYKTGGGSRGNAAKNTVTQIVTSSTTVLTCNNAAKMTGGSDRKTVTQLKVALPADLSTQNRGVSDDDYASLALNISGVAKAAAEKGSGVNEINLFIAPSGGGQPSNVLLNSVISGLQTKKMSGTKLNPGGPYYQDLRIEMDLNVLSTARRADTEALVRSKTLDALDFSAVEFGGTLRLQSLYLLLSPEDTQGVDSVVFRKLQGISTVRTKFGVGNTGNGTFVDPNVESNVGSYQWDVLVSDTTGTTKIDVTQKQRGIVTDLNDTTLTDITATFVAGALVGKTLIPDESDTTVTFVITANTENSITVASGLLSATAIDRTYAIVLDTDTAISMPSTGVTGANTGTTVSVSSSTGFANSDPVVLVDSGGVVIEYFLGGITVLSPTSIQLPSTPAAPTVAGNKLVKLYRPADLSFTFGMIAGTIGWVVGDSYFFDTFAPLGDIRIRARDIVQLLNNNLTIRSLGGIVI